MTPNKPEGSPLVIGDYVTIGHSVIPHGCTIGNECLIGMGMIVMDDAVIPNLRYSAEHSVRVKSNYMEETRDLPEAG